MAYQQKKKKRSSTLSVDFVTANNIDDCREALTTPRRVFNRDHTGYLSKNGHAFVITWQPLEQRNKWGRTSRFGPVLELDGQITPVARGLHVRGEVTVDTRHGVKTYHTLTVSLAIIAALVLVLGLLFQLPKPVEYRMIMSNWFAGSMIWHSIQIEKTTHKMALWLEGKLRQVPYDR